MKDIRIQILDLQKEISALSKKTFEKLALLDALVKDGLENSGDDVLQLPFHYEETETQYKLKIKTDMKIDGRIYIPKSLEIQPDKLILTKKQD